MTHPEFTATLYTPRGYLVEIVTFMAADGIIDHDFYVEGHKVLEPVVQQLMAG